MSERPPHLTVTTSDRGFDRFPPIPCVWGMDNIQAGQVSVYESSSASTASLWMKAEQFGVLGDDRAEVTSHLRITDALRLADQVVRLVAEHYHFDPDGAEPLTSRAAMVTEEIAIMLRILGEDEPILVLPMPDGPEEVATNG